jgi:hypothetical protein
VWLRTLNDNANNVEEIHSSRKNMQWDRQWAQWSCWRAQEQVLRERAHGSLSSGPHDE